MIKPEYGKVREMAENYDVIPVYKECFADVIKDFFCWKALRAEKGGQGTRFWALIPRQGFIIITALCT